MYIYSTKKKILNSCIIIIIFFLQMSLFTLWKPQFNQTGSKIGVETDKEVVKST